MNSPTTTTDPDAVSPSIRPRPLLRGWSHALFLFVAIGAAVAIVMRAPTAGSKLACAVYGLGVVSMLTISTLAVLIFSAFILVDLQRVINGGETNYVTATLSIYLSVYNVFSNLLAILGIVGGDRD